MDPRKQRPETRTQGRVRAARPILQWRGWGKEAKPQGLGYLGR